MMLHRCSIASKYEAWVVRKEADERVLDRMPWGIERYMPGRRGKPIKTSIANVRNLDSGMWRPSLTNPLLVGCDAGPAAVQDQPSFQANVTLSLHHIQTEPAVAQGLKR